MSSHARIERARLRQQVFLYIATCIRQGLAQDLRPLSIRPDQMRRIANLRANDLVELGELSGPSILFDIDPVALDDVFLALQEKQSRQAVIEQCLRRDAPRAMMQRFFGLSRHRYAKLRRELGLEAERGRSRQPPEKLQAEIHSLWDGSNSPRMAKSLLDIAERLEISLRMVWDELADRVD